MVAYQWVYEEYKDNTLVDSLQFTLFKLVCTFVKDKAHSKACLVWKKEKGFTYETTFMSPPEESVLIVNPNSIERRKIGVPNIRHVLIRALKTALSYFKMNDTWLDYGKKNRERERAWLTLGWLWEAPSFEYRSCLCYGRLRWPMSPSVWRQVEL